MAAISCVLCGSSRTSVFREAFKRVYNECSECNIIFMQPALRVSAAVEKMRYDAHQNSADNEGYRRFLSRIVDPLQMRLAKSGSCVGLDYGCGPGPVLAEMLRSYGHSVDLYDPFYQPNAEALARRNYYDFIVCTETAEHFYQPMREFDQMVQMLKKGGHLGLMTSFYHDNTIDFSKWYYARDETHVCFYRLSTLEWISKRLDVNVEVVDSVNVAIIAKP